MIPAGDAASCAATGATLARLAHGLRVDARRVAEAYADAGRAWSGPASVTARRRGESLVAAVEAVAAEVDAGGAALREHAVVLADLADRWRRLEERAAGGGLMLGDHGPVPAPGIRGEADPVLAAREDAQRDSVRAEWARLLGETAQAAGRTTAVLQHSRATLTATTQRLRAT